MRHRSVRVWILFLQQLPPLFFSMAAGFITTAIGYYVPMMLLGSVLLSVGAGLLCMLKQSSGNALWICAQIIFGAGTGLGGQQPIMAVQTVLPPTEVPVGVTTIISMQSIGGAIFVSVAESVFQNKLISALHTDVPTIDPEIIVANGASGLISTVEKIGTQYVAGVLEAYNSAVVTTFVVGTVMACLSLLGALGMEWRPVKGSKKAANKS